LHSPPPQDIVKLGFWEHLSANGATLLILFTLKLWGVRKTRHTLIELYKCQSAAFY
jgi:hypothetical protein